MFREVLNCWSEKVFVTYADDIQIECTTMLLILLSSFVDEINKHDCAVLTAGVTHYLADSDEYKRLVGMVVGKKLAAKGEVRPEKEVQIDLDPECPLMCRYDAWARFASELNNVEKGTPHITRAPDACRPEILPGGTVLHETAPETDPIAEPTEWDCVDAASVSSISSEFSSYAHSSDATSEISAYCPLGSALERPKTLIECLNYLSDSDDPDRPDQGIKALALLVPSANIGELQANIQKITKKVIWAKNNRDYEGFDERRRDVLVGLLSRVPADAARVIWTQVWDEKGQTGIREQLDVLNVIARTCAILSGQEDPKSLDVSTDERATTAGKDAGSVTWKSRNLAGVTSPKLSSLTSVAAFFFHPIVRRLPRVLDEANRGIPFQELLLGSMLRAAAIVLRFSKNIPEYSGMAFELLDALRLLRETDGLLEVVLLAYCVLAEAQHDSISSCLEDLKTWALSVHDRSLIKTRRQEQHFSALLDALKALERKRRSVFDGL